MVERADTLKIRLVIPVCDRLIGKYYCRDSEYIDERLNLLTKAFEIKFQNKDDDLYPNLVITSNNFLYIPVYEQDVLESHLQVFIKHLKPKSNTHLLIGIDSEVENIYGGISASVFHFVFENNAWKEEHHIWECWKNCDRNCIDLQERFFELNGIFFLIFSCGDVLTSEWGKPCLKKEKEEGSDYTFKEEKNDYAFREFITTLEEKGITKGELGLINLAHMDFKIYTKYYDLKYIIATTQISRKELLEEKEKEKGFPNEPSNIFIKRKKPENKIIYSLCQCKINNNFSSIDSQTIIALDKQSTDYEIINWNNTSTNNQQSSFEDDKKIKQVDAFFIDFEIPYR